MMSYAIYRGLGQFAWQTTRPDYQEQEADTVKLRWTGYATGTHRTNTLWGHPSSRTRQTSSTTSSWGIKTCGTCALGI